MNEAGQHPGPPDDSTAALLEPDGIEQDLKEGSFWAMVEVPADVRITCAHLLNAVEDQVNLYSAEGNRGSPEFTYGKNCITSLPIGIPLELSKSEDFSMSGNNIAVAVISSEPCFVSSKECSLKSSAASADVNVMNSPVSSVGETIESVIAKYAQKSLTRSRFGRVRKRRCISPSPVIPVKKSKVKKLKKCQSSLIDPPQRQPASCSKMQRKRFPGEIVWFKVLGQPFWPGMVTRDSNTGEYVRRKAGISEYHVTPFGQNKSEKWVLAPQVMKFQGKQRFEEHVRDLLTRFPEDSVKQSVVKGRFIMSSPKRKEWEEVVHEVETTHAFNDLLPVPEPPLIDSPPRSQEKGKRKRKREVLSESKMPSSMTESTEPVMPLKSNFDKNHAKCPSLNFNLLKPAKDEKQTHSHMKAKLIRSKTRKPRKNECSEVTTTSSLPAKKMADSDLALNSSNQSVFSGKKLGATESKSEKVCQVCEMLIAAVEGGVKCIGGCNSTFHITCANPLPTLPLSGDYKCEECNSGVHKCFVCKDSEGMTRRCNIRLCGKFYHHSCITSCKHARVDGNSYICSLHVCLTCFRNKSAVRGNGGRLYRCLRCPVAYHSGEDCLAAGSYIISNSTIICPAHYEPPKQLPHKKVKHVNVNWCFVCSTGGSLICCESCPASFHAECLGIEPPEGSYYCAECLSGIELMYGDIVWAKMGAYRWWPAKIINPRNVPVNIRNIPHQAGEFPVCFFGTHDYNWTCRSRVFQFLEGDQGAHGNHSNRLARLYDKALDEASVAYQEWKIAKECRAAQDYERNNLKPPPYKHIKANKPVGKVTLNTADPSQMTPCDCDPNSENPCGSDSECLNRMLMFECHPAVCPAGQRCQNQRFEKRQYVPAEPFKVEGKGWGLKCLVDVKKGQFVNEYLGELIDEEECRRRMVKMHEENNTNYYFLTIDKDRIIDAGRKGNLSRFMNHSCQPNCETHKWTVNGNTRVGLFAVRDIPQGAELTFNYNLDCLGNEKTTCRCEAPNCSGFIGDRPKKSDKVSKLKKKKKKSRTFKSMHEDICFRCGRDGELLMCDRKNCCKAYHLPCLKLDKRPHGRWDCPWHHCDICGKAASSLCTSCPNSFCKEHSCNNVQLLPDGTVYCNDHMKTDVSPVTASSTAHQTLVSLTATPAAETKVLTEEEIAILNIQKQRQRMIAEKLKIKLNGATLYSKVPRKTKVQGKHSSLKNKGAKEDKGSTLTTKGSKKKSTKCSKRSHRKSVIKFQTTPLPNGTALDVHIHKKHSNDKDYHLCRTTKDVHQKNDLKKVITLKISKFKVDTDNTAMERNEAGSRARKTLFNGVLNGEKVAKVQTKKRHRKTASKLNGEVKDGIKHPSRKMNGTLVAKKKKKKKKRKRTSSHKVPSELMSQVNNSTEVPMGMIIQIDQHETLDKEKESLTRASKSFVPDTFAQLSLPNSISSV